MSLLITLLTVKVSGLQVVSVKKGVVVCRAQNDAVLDGLLTLIHSEKASDCMSSAQVCHCSLDSDSTDTSHLYLLSLWYK